MPLTKKGDEILKSMEKTYSSEKKAKEVMYASKNAGKISGIDEDMPEEEDTPMMDKLPTYKEFRKQFRDAMENGNSIAYGLSKTTKCLDLGTTFGTARAKSFKMADAFHRSMKQALKKGLTADLAIKFSLDAMPAMPPDDGVISNVNWDPNKKDAPSYRVTLADFKTVFRDCLKKGQSVEDALKNSTCHCGH